MNFSPTVSIIIPTFNRDQYISDTLNSFINQTFKDWEAIVVDDGSTDNTSEVMESFNDCRIIYVNRGEDHKKGPSGCRNWGISLAKGEFILFFDDDDIAHPQLLEISLLELRNKNLHFCRYLRSVFYGSPPEMEEFGKDFHSFLFKPEDLPLMVTNKVPFNTCAIVWRKTCFKDNKFNEDLFYSDEWECYQRILSVGIVGISVEKVFLFARKHTSSSTQYYLNSNSKYLNSTRKAVLLVIKNLASKNKLTAELNNFFIRKAFELKDREILIKILNVGDFDIFKKFQYKIGFIFYPILKPLFNFKAQVRS